MHLHELKNNFKHFIGVPEDLSKKVVGTNWCMKVTMCGKKCYADMKCVEHPEFSECGMYMEGKECEVPVPGIPGKVRISLN